ncbi:hypothetical protein FRC03_004678, partial [Tulasnella sp. 419]
GTLALYVQIIFALALERIVFNISPPALSVIGMIIILSSAIYVAISKPRENASHKHPQMWANTTSTVSERDVSSGAPCETIHLMSIHHRNVDHAEQENVGEDGSSMEGESEKDET